jgi:hypothetical protein
LFVVAVDGGTLLRTSVWDEILSLDKIVHDLRLEWDEEELSYETLCARWEDTCYENDVLELGHNGLMDQIEAGNISLTFPVMLNPETLKTYAFPFFFGGTKVSNVSTVLSVPALQLNYFLAVNSPKQDRRYIFILFFMHQSTTYFIEGVKSGKLLS